MEIVHYQFLQPKVSAKEASFVMFTTVQSLTYTSHSPDQWTLHYDNASSHITQTICGPNVGRKCCNSICLTSYGTCNFSLFVEQDISLKGFHFSTFNSTIQCDNSTERFSECDTHWRFEAQQICWNTHTQSGSYCLERLSHLLRQYNVHGFYSVVQQNLCMLPESISGEQIKLGQKQHSILQKSTWLLWMNTTISQK